MLPTLQNNEKLFHFPHGSVSDSLEEEPELGLGCWFSERVIFGESVLERRGIMEAGHGGGGGGGALCKDIVSGRAQLQPDRMYALQWKSHHTGGPALR